MKKVSILILSLSIIALLALSMPQKQDNTFAKVVYKSSTSIPLSQKEGTQHKQYTMAPAWYRYFNPQKSQITSSLNNSQALQFVLAEEQVAENFITFNLVNTSEQETTIHTQNGSLIMIQEAKNPQGEWQPIEYWDYSMGGKGSVFSTLTLNSKESILLTAPKYQGDFATKIRFKLKLGNQNAQDDLVYSQTFPCKISLGQFHANPDRLSSSVSYLEQ